MNIPPLGVVLAVAVAGAFGAVLRYALDITFNAAAHRRAGSTAPAFPWGILAANTLACLLVGWVASWATARGISMDLATLQEGPALVVAVLIIGLGGGLSTMSTFIIGAVSLWRGRHRAKALSYIGLTIGAGLAAGNLGTLLAG